MTQIRIEPLQSAREVRLEHQFRGVWAVFWKRGRAKTEYSRAFPNAPEARRFINNNCQDLPFGAGSSSVRQCAVPDCAEKAITEAVISINNGPREIRPVCQAHADAALEDQAPCLRQAKAASRCEKCGHTTLLQTKVVDRWAYWCGCPNQDTQLK